MQNEESHLKKGKGDNRLGEVSGRSLEIARRLSKGRQDDDGAVKRNLYFPTKEKRELGNRSGIFLTPFSGALI